MLAILAISVISTVDAKTKKIEWLTKKKQRLEHTELIPEERKFTEN